MPKKENISEPITLYISLFGSFRIRSAMRLEDEILPTNILATKILAYLAFHRGLQDRAEIYRACWAAKFDENGSEAANFDRQLSNICETISQFTAAWQPYFKKPNKSGECGLIVGTYVTDVKLFDDAYASGMNEKLQIAERIKHLMTAKELYKGSLLFGMNSDWLVAPNGPREEYARKHKDIDDTIESLQRSNSGSSEKISWYKLYEMQEAVCDAIEAAKDEVILYGMNFHSLMPHTSEILLRKLKEGVLIKVLMLNPAGYWLRDMALSSNNSVRTQYHRGLATIAQLLELRGKWHAWRQEEKPQAAKIDNILADADDLLVLRAFDNVIHGRIYIVDPKQPDGVLFSAPYFYGIEPVAVPAFSCRKGEWPFDFYVREVRRLLGDMDNVDIRDIGEQLLRTD